MQNTTTKSELLRAEISLSENVVYRDFASETVVLNLQTGQYHGLNPTAGEMLAALDETGSIELAANLMAERHQVDLARVQDDLCQLCERFMQRGLIAVVPAS